jgi:hypothetical protein
MILATDNELVTSEGIQALLFVTVAVTECNLRISLDWNAEGTRDWHCRPAALIVGTGGRVSYSATVCYS